MFEYSTMYHPCKVFNQISWGAHINPTRYAEFYLRYPDWLNPHQKEEWRNRGLVIWDAITQVVTHLYANYALRILETMKDTDTWKTDGFIIGSPVYRMSISDSMDKQSGTIESPHNGWVLTNKIALSSKQTEKFSDFLVAEEETLFLIAADEDRDIREACAMVVELLIDCGRKKREIGENETKKGDDQKKANPIS